MFVGINVLLNVVVPETKVAAGLRRCIATGAFARGVVRYQARGFAHRRRHPMKRRILSLIGTMLLGGIGCLASFSTQAKTLTLCWAAWDPANALVELDKDFTKETGIEMKYEFVPWTSYADRFLNELNSHGKLCDLIIGDSRWIGGAAENHWYVKLNDFFAKEHIDGRLRARHCARLFGMAQE